jgi:hypothetical protein
VLIFTSLYLLYSSHTHAHIHPTPSPTTSRRRIYVAPDCARVRDALDLPPEAPRIAGACRKGAATIIVVVTNDAERKSAATIVADGG